MLVDNLPPGVAHFGRRLISYSRNDSVSPIALYFSDGSTATADLVVGCDGIKSVIRGQMFRELAEERGHPELLNYIEPIWTGTIAYRGLIPVDDLPRSADGTPHRTIVSPMMVGRSHMP